MLFGAGKSFGRSEYEYIEKSSSLTYFTGKICGHNRGYRHKLPVHSNTLFSEYTRPIEKDVSSK